MFANEAQNSCGNKTAMFITDTESECFQNFQKIFESYALNKSLMFVTLSSEDTISLDLIINTRMQFVRSI